MKTNSIIYYIRVYKYFSSHADEELHHKQSEQVPTVCVPNESL